MEIVQFVINGMLFSLLGLLSGIILDSIFIKLYKKYTKKHHTYLLIILQLLVNVIIMFCYISFKKNKIGLEKWEFSLLALSFPSFFFNVQFSLFDRIKELKLIK